MLTENKFSKYLIYAIGEIVLVVIGILIALQINNWNENRKIGNIRQDYYSQLLEDLNKDIRFAKTTINEFNADKKAHQDYYKIYEKDKVELADIFKALKALNLKTKSLNFNSSTIESLKNSGDIGLIPSEIRNKLIDLRRAQELIIKRADYLDKGKNEVVQKASLLIGSDELQGQLENHPNLKGLIGSDTKLNQIVLSFESTHVWKNLSENETVDKLKQMQQDIEEIIRLVNNEIKK